MPRTFTVAAALMLCLSPIVVAQNAAPSGKETGEHSTEEAKGFHFTFDNVAGALGIVFGAIGLVAYLDQRRVNREQASVFGYMKRTMTKEVSEETLARLSEQLKLMEKQTKEEMPKLARRAVLQEQALRLRDLMAETFIQWRRLEAEIGDLVAPNLDPELEKAITDKMLPSYLAKMKMEANQQQLAIGGAAVALCSFALPRPLDVVAGILLAFWMIPTVFELIAASGMTIKKGRNLRWIYRIGLSILIVGLVEYYIERVRPFSDDGYVDRYSSNIGLLAGFSAILLSIAAIPLDLRLGKWVRSHIRNEGPTDKSHL